MSGRWAGVLVLLPTVAMSCGCATLESGADAKANSYGVAVYAPSTQDWRLRWQATTSQLAKQRALRDCAVADCQVVLEFGPKAMRNLGARSKRDRRGAGRYASGGGNGGSWRLSAHHPGLSSGSSRVQSLAVVKTPLSAERGCGGTVRFTPGTAAPAVASAAPPSVASSGHSAKLRRVCRSHWPASPVPAAVATRSANASGPS